MSRPGDASEVEADRVAARILAGAPVGRLGGAAGQVGGPPVERATVGTEAVGEDARLQRVVVGGDEDERLVQRAATPRAPTTRAPDAPVPAGSGAPLATAVRARVEPALGADLGHVRVHTGAAAAAAARAVHARAFTHGDDIVLGDGASPTDMALMAHESVHVVQQAGGAAARVMRLPQFVRDELADMASHVPGYSLFTVIIGHDPIRGRGVDRDVRSILRGVLGLVPFGEAIFRRLDEMAIVGDVVAFVEGQLTRFDLSLGRLERTLERAWDRMSYVRWGHNLRVLREEFGALYDDVVGFGASLVSGLVEAIVRGARALAASLLDGQPVWELFTKVVGHDPLRGEDVEATTEEVLADLLVLVGREQELEQLRARGALARAAAWVDERLAQFEALLGQVGALLGAVWDAIQPRTLANLPAELRALATRAVALLGSVGRFALSVAAAALQLVKDALLGWLSSFVHEVPGFHLLTVLIGRDPFTGDRVPRTAENLLRGFITLLPGGNAVYDRLAATGVVGEAAARIDGAVEALGIGWATVVAIFRGIWDMLAIGDLVDPIGAFTRIRDRIGEPVGRVVAFVRVVVRELFLLLVAAMRFPVELVGSIVENAMQAYDAIRQDVVGFLHNMLRAVKQGFVAFFGNIGGHLLRGLTAWLFRGLRQAGIEPPADLSVGAVLQMVLQVLGLTVDRLWEALAERIGPERVEQLRGVADRLAGIWGFVDDVRERGLAAIWERVQAQLAGLWDTLVEQARAWVIGTIVDRVAARLLSMLDPTGIMAVVNGFVAFFDAVQSAIEYARELLEIVAEWASTIAAVARGQTEEGATRLEGALGRAVPVAIGFLANQVGLGNIGERLQEIVAGVRQVVDDAIDWLLDRAMQSFSTVLQALGLGGAADPGDDPAGPHDDLVIEERFRSADGDSHTLRGTVGAPALVVRSTPITVAEHPDADVRARYEEYRQFVADNPAVTERGEPVRGVGVRIARLVSALRAWAGAGVAPRASAPGLGVIKRHGSQASSVRGAGFEVWELESEHVVPRAWVDHLFRHFGLAGVPAGGSDYGQQHTVMVYRGAARSKTHTSGYGDNSQTRDLARVLGATGGAADISVQEAVARLPTRQASEAVEVLGPMIDDAVERTAVAVEDEADQVTAGHTHAVLRGPEEQPERPQPGSGRIREAARRQTQDIELQLRRRLEDL